jgi:hypothetical protein
MGDDIVFEEMPVLASKHLIKFKAHLGRNSLLVLFQPAI